MEKQVKCLLFLSMFSVRPGKLDCIYFLIKQMLSTDYNQHGYIVYMYAVTFIPTPPPPPLYFPFTPYFPMGISP